MRLASDHLVRNSLDGGKVRLQFGVLLKGCGG